MTQNIQIVELFYRCERLFKEFIVMNGTKVGVFQRMTIVRVAVCNGFLKCFYCLFLFILQRIATSHIIIDVGFLGP